ncbi:MAG: hypothetical protein ACLTZY_02620 [Alistipes indistinctus]
MFLEVFDKETQRMIVRVPLVDYALAGQGRKPPRHGRSGVPGPYGRVQSGLRAGREHALGSSMDVNIHSWKLVFHNKEI